MKLLTIEMAKLDVNKPPEEMNEQEKMIYYFLNYYKGIEDSKIKMMIEKRVETISDDGWKKIIEDFQKLHENEERMERQLEVEEAHKAKEEARMAMLEVNKLKQEADKKVERANKQVEDATKQTELETKRADAAEKQIKNMILRLSSTMDIKSVASVLNVSVDEIEKYI